MDNERECILRMNTLLEEMVANGADSHSGKPFYFPILRQEPLFLKEESF